MSEQITNCDSTITKIINELSNAHVLDFGNEYREDLEKDYHNCDYDSDGKHEDYTFRQYDKKYKKFGSIIIEHILSHDVALKFIAINPRALEFYPDEFKNSKKPPFIPTTF